MEGPSEVGAAMAMGNSPGMWDRVYDRSFRRREMQSAVDAMTVWRQNAVGNIDASAVVEVMPQVDPEEVMPTNNSAEVEIDLCLSDSDAE